MFKKSLLLTALFAFFSLSISFAQTPIGVWKTIDDDTGEAKSHIEIYEQEGKLYGKIVKLLLSPADKTCDACKGDKKGKPLMGMLLLEDLEASGDYWKNGNIMDPESGKDYGCSIWFDDKANTDELRVRGKHWSGFYRTQTWFRVN